MPALRLMPQRKPRGVITTSEDGRIWEWEKSPPLGDRSHFWSSDGQQCLYCLRRRSPAVVSLWRMTGAKNEVCE